MFSLAINKILNRINLSENEAKDVMNDIMNGRLTEAQMGGFLTALRMKGETIDEVTGFAKAMLENATVFEIEDIYALDTCGTGGDGGKTFNISTAVAIIAAAAGANVVKHGGRSVSSKSGSADVLGELGFDINMEIGHAKEVFMEAGMTFLFAPNYHSAMKNVAAVRKELGVRTVFNLLGPIINPANIKGQVMGVYAEELTNKIANVLLNLGRERALVVHGLEGLDEISISGPTKISEVKDGKVTDYVIAPEDFGMERAPIEEIAGGFAKENADIINDILKGKKGPQRDVVVLNAAAALYVAKLADSLKEGVALAEKTIDSGDALNKLKHLVDLNRGIIA